MKTNKAVEIVIVVSIIILFLSYTVVFAKKLEELQIKKQKNEKSFFEVFEETAEVHGFFTQGYLKSTHNNYLADTEDGTFDYNKMGLNINWTPKMVPDIRIAGQLFAKELGPFYNDRVEIDWLLIDYTAFDWLGFKIGKLKCPMGFYNEIRDYDKLRVYSLLPQSIYLELNRNTMSNIEGIEIYGNIGTSYIGDLSYVFQIGGQKIPDDSPSNILIGEMASMSNARTKVKNFGKYQIKINISDTFGLSGLTSQLTYCSFNDLITEGITLMKDPSGWVDAVLEYPSVEIYVFSLRYEYEAFMIECEFFYNSSENYIVAKEFESDHIKSSQSNWYLGGTYQLFDNFAIGGYYSVSFDRDRKDFEDDDPYDNARKYLKDLAISSKYDINDYVSAKIEIHKMQGIAGTSSNSYDCCDCNFKEDWWLFVFKLCFMF